MHNIICTKIVRILFVSFSEYDLKTPPSGFTKPTQAKGNPNFNTNISKALIKNWIYKTNNNIKPIKATIELNKPVVAIFAIVVVRDMLSAIFIVCNIVSPNDLAICTTQS